MDIVQDRAQAVASLLPNAPIVETDYRKVLDAVDAVLIVVPHSVHHESTIDCLHVAGKPVSRQSETILLEASNGKPTEIELARFLDCIETGTKPLTDPVGSLEGLQVIWKLYEAERKNEIADLRGLGLGTYEVL